MKKMSATSLGIAIFTMFFGAGNIVFPLDLGRDTKSHIALAMVGFIITAVCVPIIGLLAGILSEGKYKDLLYQIGKVPATLIIFLSMILIGSFGGIPRCIVISYSAVHQHLPNLSLFVFSIIAIGGIFLFTYKESKVVSLLGKILGPIKIFFLFTVIILGLVLIKWELPSSEVSLTRSFFLGFKEGYYTMDLLGGIFFSMLIFEALRGHLVEGADSTKKMMKIGILGGLIGGVFLSIVNLGFGFIAAMSSDVIENIKQEDLLSSLVVKILGPWGGLLGNITIALTCITAAIALTSVFAEYLSKDLFKKKMSYPLALTITSILSVFMSNVGFAGIMQVVIPIVKILYPALLVLAIATILKRYTKFKHVKTVFFTVIVLTIILEYGMQLL